MSIQDKLKNANGVTENFFPIPFSEVNCHISGILYGQTPKLEPPCTAKETAPQESTAQ